MGSSFSKSRVVSIGKQVGFVRILTFFLLTAGFLFVIAGLLILQDGWLTNLLLSAKSSWTGNPPQIHWVGILHLRGVEAILLGIFIVLSACFRISRWDKDISLTRKRAPLLALSLLAFLWLPIILLEKSMTIGGERYWWLHDDAMISMRYAHNFAEGNGLVWNIGEHVEGYSNFLWTIFMAFVHLFPIPISKTSLIVLLTNLLLSMATIPIICRFVSTLGGRSLATTATIIGFALNRNIMIWATYGMETALLTLLFLLALYRVIRESQANQQKFLTYQLIAIISLVRADAAILSALLYVLALSLNKNKKRVLTYSFLSSILPLTHEAFRICYYGDILPNTAYLKTMGWNGRFYAGAEYSFKFISQYAIMIIFAIVGSLVAKKRISYFILGGLFLYLSYVTSIGGDAFANFRFIIPIIPALMAIAFVGIESFTLRRTVRFLLCLLCIITMPLISLKDTAVSFLPYREGRPLTGDEGNIEIALLLRQNTHTASKVAGFWAGSVFYFSERYGIDLLGKNDRYIARLPAASDSNAPGHNKFDFDYSLGILKPDFLVAQFKLPVDEETMQKLTNGDLAFIGRLYYHPIFGRHFLPNSVAVDTWRTIFVSDLSPELENRFSWDLEREKAFNGIVP